MLFASVACNLRGVLTHIYDCVQGLDDEYEKTPKISDSVCKDLLCVLTVHLLKM